MCYQKALRQAATSPANESARWSDPDMHRGKLCATNPEGILQGRSIVLSLEVSNFVNKGMLCNFRHDPFS